MFPQPAAVQHSQLARIQNALFGLPRTSVSLTNNRPLQPMQGRDVRTPPPLPHTATTKRSRVHGLVECEYGCESSSRRLTTPAHSL